MKSIRARLIVSYVGTILVVFLLLAAIGVYYLLSAIELHSSESMKLLNQDKTDELNTYFSGIEKAVNVLEDYLVSNVDIKKYKSSKGYRNELFEALEGRAINSAEIVDNVETLYFRPDPLLYGGTSGFFITSNGNGSFRSLTPTNILKYDKDDVEHVGWYYEAVEKGVPVWMEPYSNENIGIYMISYVVPVYLGSDFLGVLGMDIDMTLVHQSIDNISYQGSYGLLFSENGNLLYNRDYPGGLKKGEFTQGLQELSTFLSSDHISQSDNYKVTDNHVNYRAMISRLENEMILVIETPESELFKLQRVMIFQLLIILIVIFIIIIFISFRITQSIVEPIVELTTVSSRIANGELGQEIEYQSKDELGQLADSIRKISVELKVYIDYIHQQAYLDAMTGVYNKAAYLNEQTRLERLISEKMASFTVYVFDVNGLKAMNDSKGHEYGDMMIKDAALNIRSIFGSNKVYRIGGDEFLAFAEEKTEEEIRRKFALFDDQLRIFNLENDKYEEELAISKGAATYSPDLDADFAAVFARADENMYHCKQEYYKTHGDRRRRN
ncbi:MAG: diguanylate cyclase [Butyrivibrio sp.]|nr:diguanylate cyclase [Butyrivibrio sp.]